MFSTCYKMIERVSDEQGIAISKMKILMMSTTMYAEIIGNVLKNRADSNKQDIKIDWGNPV